MANFSPRAEIPALPPGWNFVAITRQVSTRVWTQFIHCRHFVSLNIYSITAPAQAEGGGGGELFNSGWNLDPIIWGFSAFQPGRKFNPGRNPLHVIATFISRGFLSEPKLKSQPSPGWNSPCNYLCLQVLGPITRTQRSSAWPDWNPERLICK